MPGAAVSPANAITPPSRPTLVRSQVRRVLAVATAAVLLAGLSYRAGLGVNLPLGLAVVLGLLAWRRPARLASPLTRLTLATWGAVAVATVVHFDPWTVTTLLTLTAACAGMLLRAGRLAHPLAGYLIAWLLPVGAWGALGRGAAALALTLRSGRVAGIGLTALLPYLVPLLVTAGFGGLYVVSSAELSGAWAALLASPEGSRVVAHALAFATLAAAFAVPIGLLTWVPTRLTQRPGRWLRFGSVRAAGAEGNPERSAWSPVSVTLAAVNALALALNVVDGLTSWMPSATATAQDLTRGVHAGTNALVAAIVLASAYALWAFRQNLPDAARARRLALAWLAQNLVMALTVALRNAHYTEAYGLTYKRLGVFAFLAAATAGLYFLGEWVRGRSDLGLAVRRHAWAVYLLLAAAALPNWPAAITRYNLDPARRSHDRAYLWSLAPHSLPAWIQAEPKLWDHLPDVRRRQALRYTERHGPADWRAWTLSDARLAACRAPIEAYDAAERSTTRGQ